jgi:signal transduction histidine kinase/ActR/RegA family two-component response regulator
MSTFQEAWPAEQRNQPDRPLTSRHSRTTPWLALGLVLLCLGLIELSLFSLGPQPALAAPTESKVVRIGYFEDNDGFQAGFNDDEPKSGYAYEYYQELAKYTGWTYQYVYGSWSDIYQKLVSGEVDLMGGVSKVDDRLPDMLFPENIMGVESYYIFVPVQDDRIKAGDLNSLNGKKIGINDHSYMLTLFKKFVADKHLNCQVIAYPGTAERMNALNAHEIDGVVTVDNYTINDLKPTFKIGSSDYYFAVNKRRPDLLKELDEAQNRILAVSPYYVTSLQKKYFNTSVIREALSDGERAWLKQHPALKLGYLKNVLPYCGTDPATGKLTGLLDQILPDLQKFMGVTFQPVEYETLTAMNNALDQGQVDLIFPAYGDLWHAEKENYIQSSVLAQDRLTAVYKAGRQGPLFDRIALSSQGVLQPFTISPKYPQAQRIFFPDLDAALEAVNNGQATSLFISSNILYRYLAVHGQQPDLRISYLDEAINYSFGVRRGNTQLYSILNKAVTSVDPARVSSLIIQNVNVPTRYSLKNFLTHNAAAGFIFFISLLLLLGVLFVNYRRKTTQNQKQLQAAYTTARKAVRAKTEFLSNMSHDMRTPMNAIINLTSLAREDLAEPVKIKDDLDKIDTANKFLMGLINDILDMSRIESGKFELQPVVYTYETLTRYINSVIEPLCANKHIILNWQKGSVRPPIYVDEVRFNQIFFNLLSNAVKYSAPGSTITLREENVRLQDHQLQVDFVFEDHGIGMSPAFQKKLFTPFEREDSSDSRMGTGLGLAITKRILDAMQGSIQVVSAPGQGTKVTVHLNLAVPTEEQLRAASQADFSHEAAFDFSPYNILIAEDHPMNRTILLRLLEKRNLKVTVAEDGLQCLEKFRQSPEGFYGAILMDVRMPNLNGLDAARQIRALKRRDALTVPIIAMTAEAFTENKQETLAAGMNEHLSKPINPAQLFRTLQRFLTSGI